MQLPLDLSSTGFQGVLDSQPDGETIECLPHEYSGPLFFRNDVILEGRGATFWALEGPVVIVESSGVTLRDLRIEVTADAPPEGSDKDCALIVEAGADVRLENVEVRGAVRGLRTEEGAWQYPYSLNLDSMLPGEKYEFLLRIIVPVQCQISSQVSGIDAVPAILAPGRNEVRLKLSSLSKDSLVCGSLCLKTALLKRRISVFGRVLAGASDASQATAASGAVLWAPADWDSPQAVAPVSGPARVKEVVPALPPEPTSPAREEQKPVPPASAPVSGTPGEGQASVSAPGWSPTPGSTRIIKQSTPISSVWSAPTTEAAGEKKAGTKLVVSPVFQQAIPPPPGPATAEIPNGTQETAVGSRESPPPSSPRVPKSRPISIGMFAQKAAEPQRDEPTPQEVRQSQGTQEERAEPVAGKQVPEVAKPEDSPGGTAGIPSVWKLRAKISKPTVPDVFFKK